MTTYGRLVETVPRPVRAVVAEVLLVAVAAVAVLWSVPTFAWSVPVALAGCLLLPLRHIRPELAVVAVVPALAGGLGWPPAVVALYALGRRAERFSATWPWIALVVLTVFGEVLVNEALPWQRLVVTVGFAVLYTGAPTLLGLLMTTRERLTSSVDQLRQARENAVAASHDAARAQERARIGREIHDAVGHHATLIAVGAAALAASTTDEPTRTAAEQIRVLAKRALAEMRAALGLIDDRGDQIAGMTELAALVAGARAAGVDVELVHRGTPAELVPMVDRAVYRVVQESITNAVRHAPGSPVEVVLRWSGGVELEVEVRNPVQEPPGLACVDGGGRGLAGLAERVTLVGGRLDAGPVEGAEFRVRAWFPLVCALAAAEAAGRAVQRSA